MRALTPAVVVSVSVLAGCVSPRDLEEKGPYMDVMTPKSAREYSKCLAPKWQDMNSGVVSTEVEGGYRIRLDIPRVGTPAMALVSDQENGARVQVYIRNSTWSEWVGAARKCA